MDVLSDVLDVMRIGSAVVAQAELVPPWGLAIDPVAEAHVHVVQRGHCWLRLTGEHEHEYVRLDEGDVTLLRAGVAHAIVDHPKTPPEPHERVLAAMPRRLAAFRSRQEKAASATTVVLCAKYVLDDTGPHPLTASLPPLVHLRAERATHDERLQLLLELLRQETLAPGSGSELVVPRLVDALFVLVVRAWLDSREADEGWFGALRDPAITRALTLVHERPAETWSVARLAKKVGQSRATFARRFADLVGEPPVAYLTRWRMCLATKLLGETDLSLERIAERIGYESGAAFSKAFRRSRGMSPGRYRRMRRP